MFNKAIAQTPYTGDVANNLFSRINGDQYDGDISFISTMRALLNKRAENEDVLLPISGSQYLQRDVERADARSVFSATVSIDRHPRNAIILHYLYAEDNSAVLAKFDDAFCTTYPNFRELMDLRQFVSQYMNARFYISEELHQTVILVDTLNLRKFHFLQALIPRYLPWFFADNPLTDLEKRLLASLTNRYATEYEKTISEMASFIDFRAQAIRDILGSYERTAREEQLRRTHRELESNLCLIEQNLESYRMLIQQRDDLNIRVAGIQAIINGATDDSELVEYFICNRNLIPISTHGTAFDFIVKCYLDSFDPEMYETMARNANSHLFRGYTAPPEFDSIEDKRLFLNAIFSDDPLLRVKICAYYSVDTRGTVTSQRGYSYHIPECGDRIPNPHLQYHNCLGNHQRYIQQSIMSGDMIRAVEQCVSSAKSLNIGESATACRFFGELMSFRRNIIELPDGTSVNGVKALKWLKEHQTQNA